MTNSNIPLDWLNWFEQGRETYWLRQCVYEFLSSSMMDTMRVMSLDQKSRFLMLGPCSSGGTGFACAAD